MTRDQVTRRLQGLFGAGVLVAGVLVSLGLYTHSFSRSVDVTATVPNAGALLAQGAPVRLRGIAVGRVASIDATGSGARLGLALDPDQAVLVPADVSARVATSTVAGAPHVELVEGAGTSTAIRAGAEIPALEGAPGINEIFDAAVQLLEEVPVDDLSTTLTALASALDGRGERLGETFTTLNAYVTALNEHGPALARDLELSAAVATQYADVAEPLLDLVRHATVTGETLSVRADDLDDLLTSARGLAEVGTPVVRAVREPLTEGLGLLVPVTDLLAEFSPEFACSLKELEGQALNNVSLGVEYPGAQAIMTLLPGQRGYRFPDDLPKLVEQGGPSCHSLPGVDDAVHPLPYRRYDDDSHANEDGSTKVILPPVRFFPPSVPTEEGAP